MKNFEYFDLTSVGEAVALLRQHAGSAKVLAGGTDLFLRMHRRVVLPDVIVDLKRIPVVEEAEMFWTEVSATEIEVMLETGAI